MSTTAQRSWATGFYWIGMAMALACLAFVWAGNTEFAWPFEHAGFPLSWAFAGGAVVAFLAYELCDSGSPQTDKVEDRSSQLAPEWEAVES